MSDTRTVWINFPNGDRKKRCGIPVSENIGKWLQVFRDTFHLQGGWLEYNGEVFTKTQSFEETPNEDLDFMGATARVAAAPVAARIVLQDFLNAFWNEDRKRKREAAEKSGGGIEDEQTCSSADPSVDGSLEEDEDSSDDANCADNKGDITNDDLDDYWIDNDGSPDDQLVDKFLFATRKLPMFADLHRSPLTKESLDKLQSTF